MGEGEGEGEANVVKKVYFTFGKGIPAIYEF
jgi:hypothetical protein